MTHKIKISDYVKYPMQPFNGYGMLFDAEMNHICDVRGWGRLQYLENGVEVQDEITKFIIEAINEKLEREQRKPGELPPLCSKCFRRGHLRTHCRD